MLHTYVQRFDVMGNLENFCKILETKQALIRKLQTCFSCKDCIEFEP